MIWRVIIVVLLLAIAGLSLLAKRHRPDDLAPVAKPQPPQPGYYMLDATITETGPDGLPLYLMEAQRIQQNPADQSVQLDNLQLVYRADNTRDWTLTAASGFVPPNSKTIDLRGDVEIVGQPAPDAQPAIMRTSRLLVDVETSIASTRERVDFHWGAAHFSTIGFKGDLKAQYLRLESAVHGRLVP